MKLEECKQDTGRSQTEGQTGKSVLRGSKAGGSEIGRSETHEGGKEGDEI